MADVQQKSPAKKRSSKPKKAAAHPPYIEMVTKAIAALKERGGSSRQAILAWIKKNFNVGKNDTTINTHLKLAIRRGVKSGALKQVKGKGASGSFRVGKCIYYYIFLSSTILTNSFLHYFII